MARTYDHQERPQHEVTFARPCYLSTHEVTNRQFREFRSGHDSGEYKGHSLNEDIQPVAQVSHTAARAFANCCDPVTKEEFRIIWDRFPADDGNRVSAQVGSFRPSHWGLYDVHGNVWEWCSDWHAREYTSEAVTDPKGPSSGEFRITRGGSWDYSPRLGRCADRNGSDFAWRDIGFRLVSPVPAPNR